MIGLVRIGFEFWVERIDGNWAWADRAWDASLLGG